MPLLRLRLKWPFNLVAERSLLLAFSFTIASAQISGAQLSQQVYGSAKTQCPPQMVDVLTHRDDNLRTGANLHETCLTPENVKTRFGKRFTLHVQGQIYAQPLVVSNLEINGTLRNVLYVATMENDVYAFDADGGNRNDDGIPQPLWQKQLGEPLPVNRIPKDVGAALGKYNIEPYVGITSTPVIDRHTNTIFLVAKVAKTLSVEVDCDKEVSTKQCPIENRLYALDLVNGAERGRLKIKLPPPEHPGEKCFWDKRITSKTDEARIYLQRTALLLANGRIYLGFGSHQDAPCPMYHGMMLSFDTNPLRQRDDQFVVTQTGDKQGKGGIWQAGNGPAADKDGNIYIMTGNGRFVPGQQFGSNFVKLSPDLKLVDWFAPANAKRLNADFWDIDLGSAGPVLLPGTDEVIGGGKQGIVYLLKRSNLGHWQKGGFPHDHTDPPIQFFWAARRWSVEFYWWLPISLIWGAWATGYHHIHGSPAFFGEPDANGVLRQGSLYVWPERDKLKVFTYKNGTSGKDGKFIPKPAATGPEAGLGMPGGFLSISADQTKNGILWAALPLHEDAWIDIVRGVLRAFEIQPDGKKLVPLWTSYCANKSDRFNFSKYVPPTVANGQVYLATFSGFVSVYGLFSSDQPHDAPADCNLSEVKTEPSYKRTNQKGPAY